MAGHLDNAQEEFKRKLGSDIWKESPCPEDPVSAFKGKALADGLMPGARKSDAIVGNQPDYPVAGIKPALDVPQDAKKIRIIVHQSGAHAADASITVVKL